MKYSKQKQSQQNCYLKELQNVLTELSEKVDRDHSEDELKRLEDVRNKLDKLYTYKCKGAFVRAREKWMESGEKSTKYFFKGIS